MTIPNPNSHPPKARIKDEPLCDVPQYARVVGLVNIGVQPEWTFQGNVNPAEEQFELTYEIPTSLMEDGRPHWISEQVGVDFKIDEDSPQYSSRLMKRVKATCPANETQGGHNLPAMLNKPCMVTPIANKKGYATLKAASVVGIPPGTVVGELTNDTFIHLDWDTMTKADFDSIKSPLTRKRIQGADNYPTSQLKARIDGTLPAEAPAYNEELPF